MGATACTLLLAGCSSGGDYYVVREPGSAMPYYTTAVERASSGAIQFRDARTGSAVALQSSEVKAISRDDYTKGLAVSAAAAAAPVPAAAAAPVPAATAAPVPAAAGASTPAPEGKPQ
jgi:hypothetical protein